MPSPRPILGPVAALALLAACAAVPPSGPTVLALPAEGKDLARFQGEDASCRSYATASIGGTSPTQAANQAAVGSAAAGTALGVGAGALLGSAGAAAGAGAAFGAGAGLLVGSAVGADNARASSGALQARYDAAYAQCMAAAGNRLQPMTAGYFAPYAYGYRGYYPYYSPWAGPSVSLGFFGGFGPRFRHHGFHRRGFHHHGFHGGFRRR
jgi:hypothetical protein